MTLPPVGRRAAALFTALALVLAVLVTGAATASPAGATTVEDSFTNKINQARAVRGVPVLSTRPHLVAVARAQAARMASRSRLYHNPSLTSDVNNWRWVGENVGYGPDALSVHVAFMNSPAHRSNILDRDFTQVGIGAVVRDGRVWVAEVFRQPARVTTSSKRSASVSTSASTAVSAAARTGFKHTLRKGSRGKAVKRVQARLGVNRTGHYNRSTKAAVSRFQKDLGWRGRGNCGPRTWARLF